MRPGFCGSKDPTNFTNKSRVWSNEKPVAKTWMCSWMNIFSWFWKYFGFGVLDDVGNEHRYRFQSSGSKMAWQRALSWVPFTEQTEEVQTTWMFWFGICITFSWWRRESLHAYIFAVQFWIHSDSLSLTKVWDGHLVQAGKQHPCSSCGFNWVQLAICNEFL